MIGPDASAFGFAVRIELERRRRAGSSRAGRRGPRPASPRRARPASCRPTPRAGGPRWRARRARGRGSRPGRSILFTATTIGTSAARACEIDSLRLRHHAVVGRDDEHRDVGDLRAAGAHGGERLVARRVEERDLPAVDLGLVGADVLRDPAGLGLDDRGLADRVEQRRLAVVDVAHDRDDRRAGLERLLGVVVRLRLGLLLAGVLDRDLALELGGDQLDLVVGERLGRGLHLAEVHQHLDDLRHRDRRAPARSRAA